MTERMVFRFVTEADPISAVMRWFSHGAFSHVDMILDSGEALGARADHVGGKPPGVQVRPYRYLKFAHQLVITVSMPRRCAEAGYAWALSQIGKPYDSRAILGFMFDRDWRDPRAWECSELGFVALEESHFWATFKRERIKLPVRQNKVTPADLLLLLSPFYQVLSEI